MLTAESSMYGVQSKYKDIIFEMNHDEPDFSDYCWIGSRAFDWLLEYSMMTEAEIMRVLERLINSYLRDF